MTENESCKKKSRSKMSLRSLRLSLKYRPELLKLILKMRQCIRRRNLLLKSLKYRLKKLETDASKVKNTNTNPASSLSEQDEKSHDPTNGSKSSPNTKVFQDSSTQTNDIIKAKETKPNDSKSEESKADISRENAGWSLKENEEAEKSIAEQVKEVAQSALQDNGMVYVESAGMYYDYKTGYYYNSELGLYYHSDTGCYYYYSDDKQFVFHSYPDMSKVNASLIAHQKKKARKLKRERKPEDDIDNLTKHLSQDKEEDGSKPKKPKISKVKKEKKEKRKVKKLEEKSKKSLKEDKTEEIEEKNEGIEGIGPKEEKETMQRTEAKVDDSTENNFTEDNSTKTHVDLPCESSSLEVSKVTEQNNDSIDIFENKDSSEMQSKTECDKESNNSDIINDVSQIEKEDKIEKNQFEDHVKIEIEVKSEIKGVECGELMEDESQELEDGECSETESEDSDSESDASTSTVSDEDSVAKHHPPCMRVIVRETKLSKLKVGSLFVITKDGGTVGREGEQHSILLKDHNVSRNHLDIRYNMERKTYLATDLGSKNGTILNGVRMSESQEISLPLDVLHGSVIQLGETKLLCHIHPGHNTCGQCEPGLLMQVEEEKKAAYTRTVSVKRQYELELARLKNTYAPQRLAIEEKPYNDRAQARRETVGSTNHAEKTQSTDLDTSITPENKGFKLLQKMGWSKGEGLGKESQGDTEPVPLISNEGKSGLGTAGAVAPPSNTPKPRIVKNNLAAATLRLATRTKMLQPPAKAFQNEDDDDFE